MQLTQVRAIGPKKTAAYWEKSNCCRWSKDPVKRRPLKPKAARKVAQKRPQFLGNDGHGGIQHTKDTGSLWQVKLFIHSSLGLGLDHKFINGSLPYHLDRAFGNHQTPQLWEKVSLIFAPRGWTISIIAWVSPRRSSFSLLAICTSKPSPAEDAIAIPVFASKRQHSKGT